MKNKLRDMRCKLRERDGVSLYLSILVLSAIFSLGFGLVGLLMGQLNIARDISRYVPAIYAADSGIERTLYKIRQGGAYETCSTTGPPADCDIPLTSIANNATYEVVILDSGVEWCDGAVTNKCVRAIGNLGETNRALEATF